MFALSAPLKARLEALPALAGWTVRQSIEVVSRKAVPAVEIAAELASPISGSSSGVQLEVQWAVSLIVAEGPGATNTLDTAFGAVFASLHNWAPRQQGGRLWAPLRLQSAAPPPDLDAREPGRVEYRLVFTTSARFDGQP